jgi:hypothetical protein
MTKSWTGQARQLFITDPQTVEIQTDGKWVTLLNLPAGTHIPASFTGLRWNDGRLAVLATRKWWQFWLPKSRWVRLPMK